jgi:hypothetical protein
LALDSLKTCGQKNGDRKVPEIEKFYSELESEINKCQSGERRVFKSFYKVN